MYLNNISKGQPLEPTIELDGGYAVCSSCGEELKPHTDICSNCGQKQDWSWLTYGK